MPIEDTIEVAMSFERRNSTSIERTRISRRVALQVVGAFSASAFAAPVVRAQAKPLRIGIIGTGRIGSALATHWTKAGHEVLMSSRHPEELAPLAKQLGARARVGTPREAAAFGEVVLVSVPYAAMPEIGKDNAAQLRGKIVLDTSNPVETRDGAMAIAAQKKGAGVATAELLPGTRVVRAFNCIPAASLANDGNRKPERYAIPIGGDDAQALDVAQRLVRDAGFDPVVVGSLAQTRQFDLGAPLAGRQFTAAEMRKAIGR
jgi:predicted dinucleotide-binding enzyme